MRCLSITSRTWALPTVTSPVPDPKEDEIIRLRAEARANRQKIAELTSAYEDLRLNYNKAIRYFDLIRNDVVAIFGSVTWKIGHTFTAVVRRILGRQHDPQAADHIRTVIQAFDEWQQPATSNVPGAPLTRVLETPESPCFARSAPPGNLPRVGVLLGRRSDGQPTGSAWVRLLQPLDAAKGDQLHVEPIAAAIEVDDRFDVVVVQRTCLHNENMVDRLLDRCNAFNVQVIVDLDDDLFSLPKSSEFSDAALAALRQLIHAANAVTVSTETLKTRVKPINRNVHVIVNGIDLDGWAAPAETQGPRLLYMGTPTHSKDLAIVRKAIAAVQRADGLELDVIGGFNRGDKGFGNRLDVPTGCDVFDSFVEWLQEENRWSVGLAPLADTQFNEAKSPLKFLQYTALGLVTIASARGPYADVITHGVNGLLVDDSTEAWLDAITRLVNDKPYRQKLLDHARALIVRDFSLDGSTERWVRLVGTLRQTARTEQLLDQLPFDPATYLFQNPDVGRGSDDPLAAAEKHFRICGRQEVLSGLRRYYPLMGPVDLGIRQLPDDTRESLQETIAELGSSPTISVLMPTYKSDLRWLRAAIDSVIEQVWPHWQLCIVDDGSNDPALTDVLENYRRQDSRIQLKLNESNSGIAATSAACLSMAEGEYIALLDHDDELTPLALLECAKVIAEQSPDVIYSDEAKLADDDQIVEHHFKSGFSADMILAQNYISHLGVYRRTVVERAGGFRTGFDGSQDHDLLLRVLLESSKVVHIPRVLYLWRQVAGSTAREFDDKDYAWEAGRRAVANTAAKLDGEAKISKGVHPGTYRVRYSIKGDPLVSILIPFRDHADLLHQVIESVLENTTHSNFEIVGIDNNSQQASTRDAMQHWSQVDSRVRFVEYNREFNFSAINNFGARHARGDHLLLLNNDITVDDSDWLHALLEYSQRPDVGAVGGLLLYPDRAIQHAGVIIGLGGVAGHSHKHLESEHHGYFARPHVVQNISAVTGACLMTKRHVWRRAGGLNDTDLAVAFNDIDFCLRLRELGYVNVYTPHCRLIHHESRSRGLEDTPEKIQRFAAEADYMKKRHAAALWRGDEYYNPNLTLISQDFSVRPAKWEPV